MKTNNQKRPWYNIPSRDGNDAPPRDGNDAPFKKRKETGKTSTDFGTNRVLVSDEKALELTKEAKASYITYRDIRHLIEKVGLRDNKLNAALRNNYTRDIFTILGLALKDQKVSPGDESERKVELVWSAIQKNAKESPATRYILRYFSKLSETLTEEAKASYITYRDIRHLIKKAGLRDNELKAALRNNYTRYIITSLGFALKNQEALPGDESEIRVELVWSIIKENAKKILRHEIYCAIFLN